MTQKNLLKSPSTVPGHQMTEFVKDLVRVAKSDPIDFDGATTVKLFRVPKNTLVLRVITEIVTAFDGTTPSMTVGDTDLTLASLSGTEFTTVGTITDTQAKKYTADMDISATLTLATDVTGGQAIVYIEYRTEIDKQFVK